MSPVLIECSSNPQFLSNTYLLCDGEGGPAAFIDAGGPVAPLIAFAEREGLVPTHALLTHHHFDHVCDIGQLCERWPELEVMIGERERELLGDGAGGLGAARMHSIVPGERLQLGSIGVRALHTPGHTAGMLSFHVSGEEAGEDVVFTGDTLFKGSVGGVRAPGHSTYADLRDSIMGTLMELSPETVILPGHAERTTVADEWEQNPFVRVWRGLDREGSDRCTALGEPATLVLLGPDYDGGTKAWVRWADGSDDIVPGSRVESAGSQTA